MMRMEAPAIECNEVTKSYRSGRSGLNPDLDVRRGEGFGFIGPSGAGKTTTIRLLMDRVRPDRGSIRLAGLDAPRNKVA